MIPQFPPDGAVARRWRMLRVFCLHHCGGGPFSEGSLKVVELVLKMRNSSLFIEDGRNNE